MPKGRRFQGVGTPLSNGGNKMPGLEFDLNAEPPEPGELYPIDWDEIAEYDGPADQLDYDMVWGDGSQEFGHQEDEVEAAVDANVGVQGDADVGVQGDGMQGGLSSVQANDDTAPFDEQGQQGAPSTNGNSGSGSSNKRRNFYSDDLKISIYLELLSRTDPPILRRGVSKTVAEMFDVPLRIV